MKETIEKKQLIVGNKVIHYILKRKKVKNINLRIKLNGDILVSANKNVSIKRIEEFIASKSTFIFKHLEYFKKLEKQSLKMKCYETGEQFRILGNEHILQVLEGKKEEVFYEEGRLFLVVNDRANSNRKEKLMKNFFDKMCKECFDEIVDEIYLLFKPYDIEYPTIKMRSMTSKWGSCMPGKNQITLNKRLIEYPKSAIEYVVLHEFAHLIHPNHSKQFYDFVAMLMPDWKERSQQLR